MAGSLLGLVGARLASVNWPAVAWVLRLMAAHKWLVIALAVATVGGAVTEGLGIAVLVPLLDAINHNANAFAAVPIVDRIAGLFAGWTAASEIKLVAVLLAVLALLRSMFGYLMTMLAQLFTITIDQKLKTTMVRLVHRLDFERVQSAGPTNLLSYAMGVSSQAAFFCSQAATALGSVVMLALYVGICLTLSWQLTLLAGAALFLAVQFVRLPLTRRMVEVGQKRIAALIEMNRIIYGGFAGVKLLRLVAGVERHAAKVDDSVARYMSNERRNNHLQSLIDPLFQSIIAVIIAVMLFSSTYVFADAANRIPLILLFLFVLNRVISPVQTLNRLRLGLASTLPATQTIFDFIQKAQGHEEPEGRRAYPGLHRKVSLQGVGFRYALSDGAAIEGVSFDIPVRRMVALVGASGSGKTTLVGLITRLYRPQAGRIAVDDVDVAELKLAEWRRRVAVVTQDTFLFDDTVAANLRLTRPDASDAEIELAARRAEAHDFIMELPQGYATVVGERGTRLSGGQQQRLAIARALLAKPDLLILDEATSNLDADTEHLVSKVLDALAKECSILVIAHRLATVQRADEIIVLDQGRVIETGTHESLMRARGKYHGMVTRQMFVLDVPAAAAAAKAAVAVGSAGFGG